MKSRKSPNSSIDKSTRFAWLIGYAILLFILLILSMQVYQKIADSQKSSSLCLNCNILLVTFDSLRADHLGIYGYERNTSPNIDRLAGKGVYFDKFIANSDFTFRALPSLMSSKYPRLTRLLFNDKNNNEMTIFILNSTTLASSLSSEGYDTYAIYSNPMINRTNINRGFSKVLQFDDPTALVDAIMTDSASGIIEHHKSRPFFIWLHIISPHVPYDVGAPWNYTFMNDPYYRRSGIQNITETHLASGSAMLDLDYLISQYDGEILYGDSLVGSIISSIEESGLADDTLIIISSDHAESLGEHGQYSHNSLYDEVLKIPLIIYNPKSWKAGKKNQEQIQQIDVFPTIIDILNLTAPEGIEGKSFYNLLAGKSYQELPAVSIKEQGYNSIRTRNWKFIRRPARSDAELFETDVHDSEGYETELYNLRWDKNETNNLARSFWRYLTPAYIRVKYLS